MLENALTRGRGDLHPDHGRAAVRRARPSGWSRALTTRACRAPTTSLDMVLDFVRRDPRPRPTCSRACCSAARRRPQRSASRSSTRRWSSAIPPTRCTRSTTPTCSSTRCRTRGSSTPTRSSSGASAPSASTTSWRLPRRGVGAAGRSRRG